MKKREKSLGGNEECIHFKFSSKFLGLFVAWCYTAYHVLTPSWLFLSWPSHCLLPIDRGSIHPSKMGNLSYFKDAIVCLPHFKLHVSKSVNPGYMADDSMLMHFVWECSKGDLPLGAIFESESIFKMLKWNVFFISLEVYETLCGWCWQKKHRSKK